MRREFPVDGEYEITIAVAAGVPFSDALPRGRRIYLAIDKAQLAPQEKDAAQSSACR